MRHFHRAGLRRFLTGDANCNWRRQRNLSRTVSIHRSANNEQSTTLLSRPLTLSIRPTQLFEPEEKSAELTGIVAAVDQAAISLDGAAATVRFCCRRDRISRR